jgi:hypothetical protein
MGEFKMVQSPINVTLLYRLITQILRSGMF